MLVNIAILFVVFGCCLTLSKIILAFVKLYAVCTWDLFSKSCMSILVTFRFYSEKPEDVELCYLIKLLLS